MGVTSVAVVVHTLMCGVSQETAVESTPLLPSTYLFAQVMHRDLKCANLLIGVDGHLKVSCCETCAKAWTRGSIRWSVALVTMVTGRICGVQAILTCHIR